MSKRRGDPGYAGGWCIHYQNIMAHDECEAGVSYGDVGRQTPHMPCFIREGEDAPTRGPARSFGRRPQPRLMRIMTGSKPAYLFSVP